MTYATFIDKFYEECGEKVVSQKYEKYLEELEQLSQNAREKLE